MAKLKMTASVVSQAQLAEGIYDLRLKAPEIASQAAAGQFVSVYSKDGSRLLPTHQPLRNRQRGRTAASGIQSSRGRHRRVSALKAGYGRYPGASGNGFWKGKSLPDRRRYRYSSYAAAGKGAVCAEWF